MPTFRSTSKLKASTPSSENELQKRDEDLIETKVEFLLCGSAAGASKFPDSL